jgi:hypothetical protein
MVVFEFGLVTRNIKRLRFKKLRQRVEAATLEMVKHLKISAMRNLTKSKGKGYKQRKRGTLSQSITPGRVIRRGDSFIGSAHTNKKYAQIQEEGGTIRAKSAQALTIPLPGKLRPKAKTLEASGDTFIHKDVIFLKTGKTKEEIIPIYVLRRSVTIPPSRWITKAQKQATPRVAQILTKGLDVENA